MNDPLRAHISADFREMDKCRNATEENKRTCSVCHWRFDKDDMRKWLYKNRATPVRVCKACHSKLINAGIRK